jgi:hypothetical protein
MAPFMPFAPSVSTSFAPRIFSSFLRSRLIVSGIVRIGVAAGWLDQDRVRVYFSRLQGIVNHGDADAVLHTGEWIEEFEFEQHVGDRAVFFRRAIQPHERCVADGFSDVVIDA